MSERVWVKLLRWTSSQGDQEPDEWNLPARNIRIGQALLLILDVN